MKKSQKYIIAMNLSMRRSMSVWIKFVSLLLRSVAKNCSSLLTLTSLLNVHWNSPSVRSSLCMTWTGR